MFELSLPRVPYRIDDDLAELVRGQLAERAKPREPRAVVKLQTRAVRGLQLEAEVEGHRFLSDEGLDMGGTGTAPAPLRYFVAGVLLCSQVWLIKLAALDGVPVRSLRCQAEAYLEQQRRGDSTGIGDGRGFAKLVLRYHIDTGWTSDESGRVHDLVGQGSAFLRRGGDRRAGTELEISVVHNGIAIEEAVT